MSKIIFNYKGEETNILCKGDEKLKEIVKKFCNQIQKNPNNIYIIYDGKIANEELNFCEIAKKEDKERNIMNALVEEIEEFNDINNENIIRAKNIICPKCKENILIEFNEYNINLFSCKNGHELNNLSLKDFESTQYIDLSHIICDICKDKNIGNTFNNEFYFCLTCKNKLCPICKSNHDSNHIITKYDNKDKLCEIHNDTFTKFCKQCKNNICMNCENMHKNHSSVYFGDLLPEESEIKEMKEFKAYLDKFNKDIDNMIKMLGNVKENINLYYNICNNYIDNNINNKNYHTITNIKEMINNNKKFFRELKIILIENKIENRFKRLIDIYYNINKNQKDNINIFDSINTESSNYIVGELYATPNSMIKIINSFEHYKKENNKLNTYIQNEENLYNEEEIKNNCIIKINDKIIPFSYYYKFIKQGKNKIEFIFTKKLKNINHMFAGCSFQSLDLSKLNCSNIVNMSYLFNGGENLTTINLSNLNLKNVTEAENIFNDCKRLETIDLSNSNFENLSSVAGMFKEHYLLKTVNLSNVNAKNATDMSQMFYNCSSLTNLNLSNFNVQNVTNMSQMFYYCSSLTNLNLSSYNTQNVTNMREMFFDCSSLTNLNLSNFITQNVTDMCRMFCGCSSLPSLNLSNFNTQNVINMQGMFGRCSSLANINLSNFITQNVTDMWGMFWGCSSLPNLNLSNFNTQNVTCMKEMFAGCSSLTNLDLSNFNIQNANICKFEGFLMTELIDYANMFSGCNSLIRKNIIVNDINLKKYINYAVKEDCVIF